jgi:FKBP12-rapamycin complex-associated protein
MASFNSKFDTSLSMTKLEVFEYAINNTLGRDLYKILWKKSQNAEDWLDRRTNYSRSLAVMSIVGYILGLGDRHPSNIMLDRISGKILHIDFADCFEVAMKRDKFPEKVPFRLTRMLVEALEIGGIEGSFRITCENVMRVIRENKDSLNVILAAFMSDPLISFRLLIPLIMKQVKNKNKYISNDLKEKKNDENKEKNNNNQKMMEVMINSRKRDENEFEKKRIGNDERQLYDELEEKDDTESDDFNQVVKITLERVSDKIKGTDFNKNEELKIDEQIQRLIIQATSHENLSQSYLGWCPFW